MADSKKPSSEGVQVNVDAGAVGLGVAVVAQLAVSGIKGIVGLFRRKPKVPKPPEK